MKILFFGSDDCDKCNALKKFLESNRVSFDFIDAMADETQDFCDEHLVWNLPYIKIIDNDGQVVAEYSDDIDFKEMLRDWEIHCLGEFDVF